MSSYTENEHEYSMEDTSDREINEVIDKVERLPEEKKQMVYQKLEIYQGELPHPKILKGYNDLYPDAAQRIIDNGITETEHRRKMEEKYLNGQISDRRIGQMFGFIIAIVIVVGGIYLILNDHQVTGSIMAGVSAIGVVGLFTGTSSNSDTDKK